MISRRLLLALLGLAPVIATTPVASDEGPVTIPFNIDQAAGARHPLLLEAVLRFQVNATGELLSVA
jgi:hypothetical protein